jgi:predicted esterase
MTKEAREDDIQDNLNWLTALDKKVTATYKPKRKILLGFSQGGATAARWFHHSTVDFNALILWACVFPPDLSASKEIKPGTEHHFVIGAGDEFYPEQEQNELIDFYAARGYHTHRFEGKHDIDSAVLDKVLSKIKEQESS